MENRNNKLQSIAGFENIGIHLIDKLAEGIGWCFTHDTPKRLADKSFIKGIEESDLSPIEKYALISNYKKIIKEYVNQQKIVENAFDHLVQGSKPELVDDTWISLFMDKAKNISEEMYQDIWGKILAEECNNPGEISKSLLVTLEQMDKDDAEMFLELCSCSVEISNGNDSDYSPIITNFGRGSFWKTRINLDLLLRLKTLGLIDYRLDDNQKSFSVSLDELGVVNKGRLFAVYFDEKYEFPEDIIEISVGQVIFSKTGTILRKIVTPDKHNDYFKDICIPLWKNQIGISIK